MKQYTIYLSDAEDKALGIIALSQEQWINNFVHERCRLAIDEIVAQEVERALSVGEQLATSKDEIVMQAKIDSAAEVQAKAQNIQPLL